MGMCKDYYPLEPGYYFSAYGIAVKNGYKGTEKEWLESLIGPQGEPFTYEDFTPEQLEALKGKDGEDGFSPIVSVAAITGGHRVNITDKNGTKSFDVMDGEDGQGGGGSGGGADGFSPVITVSTITGGHRVSVTDKNGTKTFDVMDGEDGKDGKTPVKGTDYFTAADKAEIAAAAAGQVTPAGIGAVSKSGDTMTGNLTVARATPHILAVDTDTNSQAALWQNNNQTVLSNRNVAGEVTNQRSVVINNSAYKEDIKDSLMLYDTTGGTSTWLRILHEGNTNRSKLVADDSLPEIDGEIYWRYK